MKIIQSSETDQRNAIYTETPLATTAIIQTMLFRKVYEGPSYERYLPAGGTMITESKYRQGIRWQLPLMEKVPGVVQLTVGDPEYPLPQLNEQAEETMVPTQPVVMYPVPSVVGNEHVAENGVRIQTSLGAGGISFFHFLISTPQNFFL